jgi:general secretion pathway protein C
MQSKGDRIFWGMTLGFVAGAAWLAAQLTSVVVARNLWVAEHAAATGLAPSAPSPLAGHRDLAIIEQRNLFAIPPGPDPNVKPVGVETSVEPPPAPLDVYLVATAVLDTADASFAVFEGSAEAKIVRVGKEVARGVILQAVKKDRATIRRGAKTEEIQLFVERVREGQGRSPTSPGVAPARPRDPDVAVEGQSPLDTVRQIAENSYVVDKREVQNAQSNMNQLITQIRVTPNMGPKGEADGFKIFSIRPMSLFSKMGLRNGDVVKEVNGIPLSGIDQAYQALQSAQNEPAIQVNIIRNGSPQTLSYEIR